MSIERKEIRPGLVYSPAAMAIHNARYGLAKPFAAGKTVLDIACGEGLGAAQIAALWGAQRVVGVDISRSAIEAARENFARIPNLSFQEADAFDYLASSDEVFDLIVCIETVEHARDPDLLLRLLRERLAPGGTLVITAPNDAYYFGPGPTMNEHHRSVFSFGEFQSLVGQHFGDVHWFAGAKLQGFIALPLAGAGLENRFAPHPETTGLALDLEAVATGVPAAQSLDASSGTVFYAAICGPDAAKARSAAGVIAAQSRHHPPVPGLWQRLPAGKHGQGVLILVEEEDDHADLERRINEFYAGRLDVRIVNPLRKEPPSLAQATHIHFNSPAVLEKLLEKPQPDRQWLQDLLLKGIYQTWSAAGKGEKTDNLFARSIEYRCEPIQLSNSPPPEAISTLARQILKIVVHASESGGPQFSSFRQAVIRDLFSSSCPTRAPSAS